MLRSCFCCGPVPPRRRRSLVESLPPKDSVVTPAAITLPPALAKRRYRFHNSVHREKRNKLNHKQISLNHTVFVVPKNVPSCTPTIVE